MVDVDAKDECLADAQEPRREMDAFTSAVLDPPSSSSDCSKQAISAFCGSASTDLTGRWAGERTIAVCAETS